jgi:deazaflavin-dependent oxidoreductase (nitroreductase family)
MQGTLVEVPRRAEHGRMTNELTHTAKATVLTFNKRVLNPLMLLLAGRRHWYASRLQHVGRRTGTKYCTPVVAERIGTDVIVPLPYGTHVDWLRNVITANSATITTRGQTMTVADPQIVAAETVLPLLSARRRRALARFGVKNFVKFSVRP